MKPSLMMNQTLEQRKKIMNITKEHRKKRRKFVNTKITRQTSNKVGQNAKKKYRSSFPTPAKAVV